MAGSKIRLPQVQDAAAALWWKSRGDLGVFVVSGWRGAALGGD